jgi:hypothetical protein
VVNYVQYRRRSHLQYHIIRSIQTPPPPPPAAISHSNFFFFFFFSYPLLPPCLGEAFKEAQKIAKFGIITDQLHALIRYYTLLVNITLLRPSAAHTEMYKAHFFA